MPRKKIIVITLALIVVFLIFYFWANIKSQAMKLHLSTQQTPFINTLNPQAKLIFVGFINEVKQRTGYDIYITSSYRTPAEQTALQAINPLAVGALSSYHNFGMALDLNPVKDGVWINTSKSEQEWRDTGVPDIAYEYGLRWGGDFNTPDKVHFDMGNYYGIQELRDLLTNQLAYNPTMEGCDIVLPVS